MERTSRPASRIGLPPSVWALAILLGLASVLLVFGRDRDAGLPSADSIRPSGAAAFAELLRRRGYRVRVNYEAEPRLEAGEVAFAFIGPTRPEGFDERLLAWLSGGGRAVLVGWDTDAASGLQPPRSVRSVYRPGEPLLVRAGGPGFEVSDLLDDTDAKAAVWTDGRTVPAATLYAVGRGVALTVSNPLPFANRTLDHLDHATFAAGAVELLAEPGARVAFLEAGFGNHRQLSLGQAIGPWFATLQWTLAFVFCAVAFTLGRRFGRPSLDRTAARGSRDLVDAFADAMARGRKADLALRLVADHAELVAPDDEEVRHAVKYARNLAEQRPRADEALPVAKMLDEAIRGASARRR